MCEHKEGPCEEVTVRRGLFAKERGSGEIKLLRPWSWTSRLQNWEIIFMLFKSLRAEETNTVSHLEHYWDRKVGTININTRTMGVSCDFQGVARLSGALSIELVTIIMRCTVCVCACVLSHFSHVWLFMILWTAAHQAPLSMGIL